MRAGHFVCQPQCVAGVVSRYFCDDKKMNRVLYVFLCDFGRKLYPQVEGQFREEKCNVHGVGEFTLK
jgi:hypothetical protein